MAFYRNTNFTKRNYNCTNVAACEAESAPSDNYVECDESFVANMQKLWAENGVRYYGWM